MSDPIDMLELAKKLIPDIETGMPEDMSKAFAEGKIKSIFRTSDSASLSSFGKTGTSGRLPGKVSPGSTYFMHEDGGIARYGRHGKGWADDRVSVGAKEATGGVFLDEAKFTKQFPEAIPSNTSYFDEGMAAGRDFNEPKIGLGIIEYDKGPAGAIRGDRYHEGHYVSDIYRSSGEAEFTGFLGGKAPRDSDMNIIKSNISDINFEIQANGYGGTQGIPSLKTPSSGLPPTAPPTSVAEDIAPTSTGRLRGTAVPNSAPRPGSITMQSAAMSKIGHINSPKYGLKVPDMNINHGWKIHGDLVADLTREEAFAKIGLETTDTGAKIVDQKAYDAFNSRLSKIGIDPANVPNTNVDFAESFLISRRIEEVGSHSTQMVNGRPMTNLPQYNRFYSDPLDTLSMMEVFHENQTQYKASAKYGDGRSFTGYTQSIENRDKLISSLESRLGDRLQDINPTILGGHQTEGATQLSQKITGRFTTEYTDIPSAGGAMDWASQNPAASKGQAAIDNVMATNPQMRPYIHTGVIDDQSAANLKKLTDDFPVFNEMLHGPNGYVSPYATIEDTFSQQGYDYKTGKALAPSTATAPPVTPVTPVTPPPTPPTATISQRKLDAIEEMAANGTNEEKEIAKKKLEELRRSGRVPRTGPSDLGRPTGIRTTPSAHGADVAAPHAGTGTKAADVAAEVTTDAPKVRVTNPPSSGAPSKTKTLLDDAAEAARNVARGHGNAKTLGIAGAAALLGVGYVSTRNKNNPPRNQGTYMDESRRRLGY
jgi:hypothetical protein